MEEQSQPSGIYRFQKEKADDGSECFILEKARKTVKGGKKTTTTVDDLNMPIICFDLELRLCGFVLKRYKAITKYNRKQIEVLK